MDKVACRPTSQALKLSFLLEDYGNPSGCPIAANPFPKLFTL